VPLPILSSAGDRLVDPGCSRRLAESWRAAHHVHPDAGHDLPLDDGAWVAERIATWLGAGKAG
jgi:pimeloyl-ACP methyl ester carboxylesterase